MTNQVQFVRFNDAVSTELMAMLRLKLHCAVECIDRNTLYEMVSSVFSPVCLSSLTAVLFLPLLEAEVLACCRRLTQAVPYLTGTIAYSFTRSVMFLWSSARLRCLSHIFKWIP